MGIRPSTLQPIAGTMLPLMPSTDSLDLPVHPLSSVAATAGHAEAMIHEGAFSSSSGIAPRRPASGCGQTPSAPRQQLHSTSVRGDGMQLSRMSSTPVALNLIDYCALCVGGMQYVRAVQGHTMLEVQLSQAHTQLQRLEEGNPTWVVHGTSCFLLEHVLADGLRAGGNSTSQHPVIYFRPSRGPGETGPAMWVHVGRAMDIGCPFFETANGTFISPGIAGTFDASYLTAREVRSATVRGRGFGRKRRRGDA